MLDTYPPSCFLSLFFIHGCCNHTLEPKSRSTSEVPTTTWRSPTTRSSLEVPRQEASDSVPPPINVADFIWHEVWLFSLQKRGHFPLAPYIQCVIDQFSNVPI